jgi:small neutral amino acid transporter SnatA (MarC family)
MAASAFVLLSADRIARFAGERVLAAFERLVGLVLTAIAIEMLLRGIEAFVRQLERGGPG